MAQTLLSTMPVGRQTSRSTSPVRSVGTPDERLGHAIQSAPSGDEAPGASRERRAQLGPTGVKRDEYLDRIGLRVEALDAGGQSAERCVELSGGVQHQQARSGLDAQLGGERRPGIAYRRHEYGQTLAVTPSMTASS